jgi:GNAT superfamily N-acetyltransferase
MDNEIMPTYSYKGYDFDVDHNPTEEEFAQLSKYVDTLPPKEAKPQEASKDDSMMENAKELAKKSWGDRALEMSIQGPAETALGLITGFPGFVSGSLGKAKSLLTGKMTDAELEQAAKEATPSLFNKITYEPRTEAGKMYSKGVSKAFETAGDALGGIGSGLRASVEAVIEGSGQTGAQRKFEEYQKVVTPVTRALLEIGMVGKGAKDLRDNYVQKQQDTVRKLVVEEEAKKQPTQTQPQGELFPQGKSRLTGFELNEKTGRMENQRTGEYIDPLDNIIRKVGEPVTYEKPIAPEYPGKVVPPMEEGLFSKENLARNDPVLNDPTLPRLPPEEPRLVEDERPLPELPKIDDTLFEQGKNREIEQTWEQKKAQEQAESSAAKEDAFARAEAEQAPLTLEPGQGTSGLFGFGKRSNRRGGVPRRFGQSGASNFGFSEWVVDGIISGSEKLKQFFKTKEISAPQKTYSVGQGDPVSFNTYVVDLAKKAISLGNSTTSKLKNDEVIHLVAFGDVEQGRVVALNNKGEYIGDLSFMKDGNYNPDVFVKEEYRRKGLATDLYDLAETKGAKIPAVDDLGQVRTDDGQAFRQARSLGGTGKSGFGQGGAIGFGFGEKITKAFSPKTFEEFAKDFYEKNPDLANISESSVRAAYEKMYPMKSKGALQAKAFGDLVGDKDTYNKYESRPVMDDPLGEKSVERMKGLSGADSEPLGVVKANVMSAGRMPSWMSKSPIIHEGIQFITSVKDHYRVKSADTMSPINKMFNASERGLSQFVKGIKDTWREAAEVLSVRREHEFDPTFDPKTQFSGKQLELFTKIDETLKNLYTEINTRRKQLDPKAQDLPQLPYYFTSFFKGDWAVPVFDSTTGQFLFNLRETKKADAIKAQEWVNQQQGMVAKEVGLLKQSKYVDKKMDAASDFDTLLKTFGSNDPAVVAAMQRLANSSKNKAGNTAGMPNRFLNKEGRFGSLGDKPWLSDKENYYGNKEALTRYVEGANDWLANTQIAKFSEGMLKSEKDINAPNAVKFIQDYSDYVIGKKEIASQITKGVDSAISHFFNRSTGDATSGVRTWANALTAQYIGYFSPRAMIQNVFQPISATVPKMLEMGLVEGYKGNPFTALMVGMVEGVLDSCRLPNSFC